jgi:hypothetical protein
MRKALCAIALVAVGIVVGAPRAEAKGSPLDAIQDRYEPGQTVTMIGYTSQLPGAADPREPAVYQQFQGYMVSDDEPQPPPLNSDGTAFGYAPSGVPLGSPEVQDTGRTDFPPVRVSLTFTVPHDLAPGIYFVYLAEPTGTTMLGDMMGGTLHVGIDPLHRPSRLWPLDEPAIAELADDAQVWAMDSGETLTAAQVRAGDIPPPTTWVEPLPAGPDHRPVARSDRSDRSDLPTEEAVAAPPAPDDGRGFPGWAPWLVIGVLVAAGAVATRRVHRIARAADILGARRSRTA